MPIQRDNNSIVRFETVKDIDDYYNELNNLRYRGNKISLSFNFSNYSQNVCEKIIKIVEKAKLRGLKPYVEILRGIPEEIARDFAVKVMNQIVMKAKDRLNDDAENAFAKKAIELFPQKG